MCEMPLVALGCASLFQKPDNFLDYRNKPNTFRAQARHVCLVLPPQFEFLHCNHFFFFFFLARIHCCSMLFSSVGFSLFSSRLFLFVLLINPHFIARLLVHLSISLESSASIVPTWWWAYWVSFGRLSNEFAQGWSVEWMMSCMSRVWLGLHWSSTTTANQQEIKNLNKWLKAAVALSSFVLHCLGFKWCADL